MKKSVMENKDKYSYFQEIIQNKPRFLEYPNDYPAFVHQLLFLFFGGSAIFSEFCICPGLDDIYGCVAIIDLDENLDENEEQEVLYQINRSSGSSEVTYRVQKFSDRGYKYLKEVLHKIFKEHVGRSIEEVNIDLAEIGRENIEMKLRSKDHVHKYKKPENVFFTKARIVANVFFIFFKERDTEITFGEYFAKIQYTKDFFICTIFKNDILDSKISLNPKTNEVNPEMLSEMTNGITELELLIANKVFAYYK